jgi:hypothetical protein
VYVVRGVMVGWEYRQNNEIGNSCLVLVMKHLGRRCLVTDNQVRA